MNLPQPQSVTFSSLFAEIENGTIKIPQFQRDFVWSKAESAKLLDSIIKGYPMDDDYDKFFKARCKAISRELGKLIITQEIDVSLPAPSATETVVEEEEWLAS